MSEYVYVRDEHERSLWTVGFYSPDGKWHPHMDCESKNEAAEEVARMNGGYIQSETVKTVTEEPAIPQAEQLAADYAKWYSVKSELLDIIFTCEEVATDSKQTLEYEKAAAYIRGEITGKNEAERSAQLADKVF